jgi:hypothetical protein
VLGILLLIVSLLYASETETDDTCGTMKVNGKAANLQPEQRVKPMSDEGHTPHQVHSAHLATTPERRAQSAHAPTVTVMGDSHVIGCVVRYVIWMMDWLVDWLSADLNNEFMLIPRPSPAHGEPESC